MRQNHGFSVANLAAALGITHERVYQLIKAGKIERPTNGCYTAAQFTRIVARRRRALRRLQALYAEVKAVCRG